MRNEYFKVFEDRNKTSIDFDRKHVDFLKYIDGKINLINYEYLQILVKKPSLVFIEIQEFMFLIFRAIEYFISSTCLLRQRAFFEAGTILRMSIETAATAYHIKENKTEFINYKNNNYRSTKAIGFVAKKIPVFGKFWGDLSNLFVHINTLHGVVSTIFEGNNEKFVHESGSINFGMKNADEKIEYPMIILSKISICIIYRLFELILYKDVIYEGIKGKYQPEIDVLKTGAMVETEIDKLLNELNLS